MMELLVYMAEDAMPALVRRLEENARIGGEEGK